MRMGNNSRLQQLLDSYFKASMSELEKAELLGYFDNPVFQVEIEERLGLEYDQETGPYEMDELQQAQVLAQILKGESGVKPAMKTRVLWTRPAIAAAVALVIFAAGLFYFSKSRNELVEIAYNKDISPGKHGATLTLANGKKIRLSEASDGELANESGVTITKSANGQLVYEIKGTGKDAQALNTLSTSKGETYQVRLPDGSMVWLNAASSLTYPVNLTLQTQRRVSFTGEGYFEIAKDKAHPFIVQSGLQELEVLGTHFNVNSYTDEPSIRTTLLEGSVRINKHTLLKPNQQSKFNKSGITVAEVKAEVFTDWKNGIFNFENESLTSVMRKIARWYDVEVQYDGQEKAEKTYSGTISKYGTISTVLKLLAESEGIRFKVAGKKVTVMY